MRRFFYLTFVLFLLTAGSLGHAGPGDVSTRQAAKPADSGTTPDVVLAPLGEKADAVLREAEAKGYSGVALVAKGGEIVLRKGYGMSDRAARIPMTAGTIVQIGSCTKDFTIVAILQLHERGLLDVKDPITKYFKNVPEDKRDITIWHLVTQKSGLIDHVGGDFEPATKESIVRGALGTTLLFRPGSDRSYSNMAFNLLAAIIEDVSKQSFDEYVRDHVCTPLGLRDTGFLLPGFDPKRVAHGYLGGEDHGIMIAKPHAPDGPYWNLRGAGGMLSTVTDMFLFYAALHGDQLMKPETRDMRFPPGQPVVLAGSDLVQYFFYNHEPAAGIDILLSSTSSEVKAPQVLDRLRAALGMPVEKRERQVETSPKTARKPATPEAKARVDAFFEALRSGDPDKFETMARENYTPDLFAKRTPAERKGFLERIREDFGALTLDAVQMLDAGTVAFTIRGSTGLQGRVEMTLEAASPRRIERVAVSVGD
jgi:CubicO group peptidase (beta-lactamase class C family)